MRTELHVLQGRDIDMAAWRGAFDAMGLEVEFVEGLELPLHAGLHSGTARFRVIDPAKWRLGDELLAGDHAIELRREGCLRCEPYPGSDKPREEIVIAGDALAAWLCAATFSFASDRSLLDWGGRWRVAPDDAFFVAKRAVRKAALEGGRTFVHEDGRKIEVNDEGDALTINIFLADDPDPVVRRKRAAELGAYVEELTAEGFSETTERCSVPELDVIEEMIDLWRRHDPAFDVDALAAPLRASKARTQIAEALTLLEVVWVRQPDGTHRGDPDMMKKNLARAHEVLMREDAAVDAALLLALRPNEPSGRAQAALDLLLARRAVPAASAFPALLSCIRSNPGAANVLARYRPLPDALAEPLLQLLEDPRWETAGASAFLLSRRAAERRFFDAIWAHRSDKSDLMITAVLSACEAQRDPVTIPWVEKLAKRRDMGSGWKQRIEDAIATIRGGGRG